MQQKKNIFAYSLSIFICAQVMDKKIQKKKKKNKSKKTKTKRSVIEENSILGNFHLPYILLLLKRI